MDRVNSPVVYVVGAAGQLGSALLSSRATPDDVEVRALRSSDVDLTSDESVRSALSGLRRGDRVINAAAFTDVDGAETEREAAFAVNADGPRRLAEQTARAGARLIQVSTDYVFGPDVPYRPLRADDLGAAPTTVYGASKLAGERAATAVDPSTIIVRTAWVFTGRPPVRDFVTTMIALEAQRDELTVVDDQTGSPTYAPDLAGGLWEVARRADSIAGDVLNATNSGEGTWCDLARAVFSEMGADPERVRPCTTDEFPRPAPRPPYSVLSGRAWADAGLRPLRPWRAALAEALGGRRSG
ncbi:NAD(P)-dependent oxidoreductase [Gordonia spumicola]|uniref:dTDP-4-dehydrorhamnose reductase n=1 Tax=Gordonia spumicola TaxID=589161 RepID=A0A7I9V9Z2_9ACTN|nr:dTDP-4-dehydrorhamnose reductase [Gordonia spumicola]GEE02064.1 NAD(P)-dependent oxidoreductase [Gordonia spumicola]